MKRKLLSLIVAAIMVLSLIPAAAFAEARTGNHAQAKTQAHADSGVFEHPVTKSDTEATIVLSVPDDVWGDGTGYQMLLDANATAYGSIIPASGGLTTSGDAPAGVYDEFEYKIPENADGSLTTQNILVSGQLAISVPAGTYDWCITNPTPGDRVWIASEYGNIPGRYDDYAFEANKTYVFTVSFGGEYDQVDLEIVDGVLDLSVINTVSISNFVEPIWGAAPFYDVTVPNGGHYSITYTDWNWEMGLDGDVLGEGDVFNNPEYGYFMFFVITPDEGYTFAEDTVIKVNGNPEFVGPNSIEADEIVFATIDFFVVDLDTALNAPGGNLHFVTEGDYPWIGIVDNESDRSYAISGNAGVSSSESVLTTTVTVEEGGVVTFDYKAWGEGTSNLWDKCQFIVDGEIVQQWGAYQNQEWETYNTASLSAGEHTLVWKYTKDSSVNAAGDYFMVDNVAVSGSVTPDPYAIHEVYVNGWGSPVEGIAGIDNFFLTTPEDAPYYIIAGGWRDETDQQQMWNESHIFIAGHEYTEGCQIWANEGYYFAEDCVFYADGGTEILDLQWCYVDEADNWICYMNSIPVVCEAVSHTLGDVDLDGDVDTADALLALRCVLGLDELNEAALANADVDGNGSVNVVDTLLVLRMAMGLIEEYPVAE